MDQLPETIPAPADALSAPADAPPAEPTPRGSTYQEQKFFANLDASSLPSPAQPTQEPVPVQPPIETPVVDEPTPEGQVAPQTSPEVKEDDFSVELPGVSPPEDGVLLDTSLPHPDFPLGADAPSWTKDAFDRIQQDLSLSDDEKKTIAELPPTSWDKARRWNADTKTLGKYRNAEVPISEVFDVLTKQSKDRTAQLEIEAINRVVSDPEKLVQFAEAHTPVFAQLMAELVNNHADFVSQALQRRGFNVVKAEPFDIEKIKQELKSHPLYGTFEDTDLDTLINDKLDQMAKMVGTNEVSPEDLAAEMSKPSAPSNAEAVTAYQTIQTEVKQAQTNHWLKSISDGLSEAGIKPASADEKTRNAPAAHMKDVIYSMALHGLPGLLSDWDSHSAQWGDKRPGYNETFKELQSLLQSGDIGGFKANAPSMNPFYYEFGKSRGNIALIQNLYRAVDKLFKTEATPPPPEPALPGAPAPTIADPSSGGQERGSTFSERRYFASLGK